MDKFIFNENLQTWENYISNIKKLLSRTCIISTNDSIFEENSNKIDKSYLNNISNEGKDEGLFSNDEENSNDYI